MTKATNIGPLSIVSYFSFTLIFFIIKGKIMPGGGITWIIIFFFITGFIQFMNNLYLTSKPEMCGEYNIPNAFFATLIPWTFIFGLTCAFLILMPGWLRVFSNTFGNSIAEMAGLKEVAYSVLGTKNANEQNFETRKIIELIYTDPTTIINEVDINDYDSSIHRWPSLEKILTFVNSPTKMGTPNPSISNLHKLLSIKEDVGYFVWFLLIGGISILVSTNTLLISKCTSSI
uniref:Uncharacterized protein n=1 Tax=viral metagenome TaxID=1070528 RepID=A0A6C0EXM9_9ZZZZ